VEIVIKKEKVIKISKNNSDTRMSLGNHKAVNPPIESKSINLFNYLFLPKSSETFTALTMAQQTKIRNIEKYWINRVKNFKNWKYQKHWSYKKESISTRVETRLHEELKTNNNNRSIQNFVRHFLRDSDFRNQYFDKLYEQYSKDQYEILSIYENLDYTDKKALLIDLFPKVISGEIYTIEKELFTFYSTFLTEMSTSYMIKVALIHFRNEKDQEPIEKEEVIPLLMNILKDSLIGE